MTSYALSGDRGQAAVPAIAEWVIKRGMLCLFLLVPVAAVLIGYLLRLIPLPVAIFGVFVSVAGLTAWVSYRLAASEDPDEPVHHLHRYALYALLPVAIFSLVQIPAFFAADVAYWQLWYELGTELTREPGTELWSLAAGMILYVLVGMSLVISTYVLGHRHRLLTAVGILGILAPTLFLYLFSEFSVAGAHLGPAWSVTFWLASGVGAITAWVMPMVWPWVWRVLHGRALFAVLTASVLLVTAPFVFAVERATSWQSGEQQLIDNAAFDRITLEPSDPLVFAGINDQAARYDFLLRFGPRSYTTAVGGVRFVDASPVMVEGQLIAAGATVAWCTGHVSKLASPNALRDPATFLASAQGLEYVDVPVSCAGPATAIPALCAVESVAVRWEADVALIGHRSTQPRQFSGQTQTTLKFPAGSVCS